MSQKNAVLDAIQQLPDEATFEEILDEIALLAAIRRGEEAADAGQVISHEEMSRRVASWIAK